MLKLPVVIVRRVLIIPLTLLRTQATIGIITPLPVFILFPIVFGNSTAESLRCAVAVLNVPSCDVTCGRKVPCRRVHLRHFGTALPRADDLPFYNFAALPGDGELRWFNTVLYIIWWLPRGVNGIFIAVGCCDPIQVTIVVYWPLLSRPDPDEPQFIDRVLPVTNGTIVDQYIVTVLSYCYSLTVGIVTLVMPD